MHVLEDQDQWGGGRHPLDQRVESALHLLHERGLVAPRLAQAEEQPEPGGHALHLRRLDGRLDQVVQAAHRLVRRFAVVDAGQVAHHRGDGRERRAVSVGLPAADHRARFGVEAGNELVAQPRLADARLAEQREQVGATRRHHPRERVAQDRQLDHAPDERDRPARRPRAQFLDRERAQLRVEPLRLDQALLTERHRTDRELARGLAGQDLARLGGNLDPRGGVHDRAGHQQLPGGAGAGRGLARLDPHADLERVGKHQLAADPPRPVRMARPARTARTASSSWTCGRPKTAITASPMNFSGWPRSAISSSVAAS